MQKKCQFYLLYIVLLFTAINIRAETTIIHLPAPVEHSISLEKAIKERRSIRKYQPGKISLQDLSQLLWSAQGVTSKEGFRTAPSAGAIYPIKIYLVASDVNELISGIYRYIPKTHSLILVSTGDKRKLVAKAALQQDAVKNAAIDIVITGSFEKTEAKYGVRGKMYVYMEAGHIAQNIALESVPLKLGAVTIGAFNDLEVANILNLPQDITPLYIIAVGKI